MPSSPGATSMRGVIALALLFGGVFCWGAFRVLSGLEHHAFTADGSPPSQVRVTGGNQYQLSVPGGVSALLRRGAPADQARCTWSLGGSATQVLQVAAEPSDTKATNVVGGFTAPISGEINIDCAGWGPVYVDDADKASGDPAGAFLLLAVAAMTVGAGLGLSALRGSAMRRAPFRAAGQEIEGNVDVGTDTARHREVRGDHTGDVAQYP